MPTRVPSHRSSVPTASRHRAYDRLRRNAESKRFYHTAAWLKARVVKLRRNPACERCLEQGELVQATHVHHIIEIADDMDACLDIDNMQSLCAPCHSSIHARERVNA